MKRILLVFVLGFAAACSQESTSLDDAKSNKEKEKQYEEQVIYGDDNRIENYQATEALKTLAASTVALVKSSSLVKNSQGQFDLLGGSFGDQYNLCASEPFREQSAGAFCSGSLVAPDIVMTAGHCVTNTADCSNVRFVFDYAVKAPGVEKKTFSPDEVYSCREIIARDVQNAGADYAFIRLDRPVSGKSPLAVRRSGNLSPGDPLFVIGHPAGLPQKIAGGAQVRTMEAQHFVANLDTYGGNSGSAVFNANNQQVEGILVRGETDFTWSGSCSVSYRCVSNSCRGEDVTRIDKIAHHIPVTPNPPEPPPATDSRQSFGVIANLAIPDYPKAGVTSSVKVSGRPSGRKVQVQVDLKHTYRGDLVLELTSPSGKKVVLQKQSGGSLDDIRGTYGVDLTSFQPLAALSSESQTGTWSLRVTDKASADTGVLNSWTLVFTN